VTCAESLRVQAYFDAQVDAIAAADLEEHIERCAECRALLQDLEQTRASIRRHVAPGRASTALRSRIMRALDEETSAKAAPTIAAGRSLWRTRPFWLGALGGMGSAALAATLAFLLMSPLPASPLLDELLAAHVRSLMPSHLTDVVSTDRHTVKPWFAGHTDVSPVVADFAPQGYRLVGGRADYLERQRAAVVVYQHGPHLINVFSWAAASRAVPKDATRNGYHMAFWQAGDLQYCAVSDTGWDELMGLVRLLKALSAQESPG